MSMIIDLSERLGARPVNPAGLKSSLAQAVLTHGRPVAPGARYDSVTGYVGGADVIDRFRLDTDHRAEASLRQRRADSLPAGVGGFPRDFEHIRTKVWEEKRQPLTAMRLFGIDSEVPLGARTHTARRFVGRGEAELHRGGTDFPVATGAYVEEQFGVGYVVCAVNQSYFEMLSNDFAGRQQYQRELRLARRLVEEKLNRIAWEGHKAAKLYGVLDYPALAKRTMAQTFSAATDGEDLVADLNELVDATIINSGGMFIPNRMAVSPQIHRLLHQKKHSSSGGTDTTVAEFFLRGQPENGIKQIDMAPELASIDSSGRHGVLCFNESLESTAHVMIQAPTILPVFQSSPLDTQTVVFAATGGMVMGDVGTNILGLAAVS